MKKPAKRLSAFQRRQQIIEVASLLFARKGLHGVTTKEIARACRITEPVLYQHFAGKEEIYHALQSLCQGQTSYFARVLRNISEGSHSLVVGIYLLCYTISLNRDPSSKEPYAQTTEILTRLMGYSFLEDGRFAKALIKDCIGSVMPFLKKSYAEAQRVGEAPQENSERELWLAYELIISSSLFNMPKVIPSLEDEDVLLERILHFILRGLGLKQAVIERHCDMKALRKWIALPASWDGKKP